MPNLPTLLTTGETGSFNVQPVLRKPLNLLPFIQNMRSGRTVGRSGKTGTKTEKKDDIKGRIGAVNQYYETAKRYENEISAYVDQFGTFAASMPGYKQAVRSYQDATSDARQNVIDRQTEAQKRYEANIKGKGAYYHIGEFLRTGVLKKHSEWANQQERGRTAELGQAGAYVEDFDFDPINHSLEDARKAADEIYGKHGEWMNKSGRETIVAAPIGNMEGALSEYNSFMQRQNYGKGVRDPKTGEVVIPEQLDAAHRQALSRAFTNAFDPTDPLSSGYLQGFLQSKQGLDDYLNKDGVLDKDGRSRLSKDFQTYVENDLEQHYRKRKTDFVDSDNRKQYQEQTDNAYKKGDELTLIEEVLNATTELTTTVSSKDNIGMPASMLSYGSKESGKPGVYDVLYGKTDISLTEAMQNELEGTTVKLKSPITAYTTGDMTDNDLRTFFKSKGASPFLVSEEGGAQFVRLDPDYSPQTFYRKAKEFAKNKGLSDEEQIKFAKESLVLAEDQRNKVDSYSKSKGRVRGSLQDVTSLRVDPIALAGTDFFDIVNDKDILGTDISEWSNMPFTIGTTSLQLGNLNTGLKAGESYGSLNVEANEIPTNMYSWIQGNDGKLVPIQWISDEYQRLSPEDRQKLVKNSVMTGTFDMNMVDRYNQGGLKLENAENLKIIATNRANFSGGRMIKMTTPEQDVFAFAASNPEASPNIVYMSPAGFKQAREVYATDKKQALHAWKDTYIDETVPFQYHSDKNFKENYDKLNKIWTLKSLERGGVTGRAPSVIRNYDEEALNETLTELVKSGNLNEKGKQVVLKAYKSMPPETDLVKQKEVVAHAMTGNLSSINWDRSRTATKKTPAVEGNNFTPEFIRQSGYTVEDAYVTKGNKKVKEERHVFRPNVSVQSIVLGDKRKASSSNQKLFNGLSDQYNKGLIKNSKRTTPGTQDNTFKSRGYK